MKDTRKFPDIKKTKFDSFASLIAAFVEYYGGSESFITKVCKNGQIELDQLEQILGGVIPPYIIVTRLIMAIAIEEYKILDDLKVDSSILKSDINGDKIDQILDLALKFCNYSAASFEENKYFHMIKKSDWL